MQPVGNVQDNLTRSLAAIREAAQHGADLILFPEVQLTPFFPQYPGQDAAGYAVTIDSETVREFQSVCRIHSADFLIGGRFEGNCLFTPEHLDAEVVQVFRTGANDDLLARYRDASASCKVSGYGILINK